MVQLSRLLNSMKNHVQKFENSFSYEFSNQGDEVTKDKRMLRNFSEYD